MSAGHLLDRPHHDPSPAWCDRPSPELGDEVTVRVHVPHGARARDVVLRVVRDGEPALASARAVHEDAAGTTWQAAFTVHNPVSSYRFLVLGADGAYGWLNGSGLHARDVTDAHDFRLLAGDAPPHWAADGVVYQVFPDRFARSGTQRTAPAWAVPCAWDDPVVSTGPDVPHQWFGGDLAGVAQHLDHLERLGATVLYLTPVFEGRSNHRYDAVSFDRVDPLLGGDEALAALVAAAHRRGIAVLGDLTTNHTGSGHEWFAAARADAGSPEASFYRFRDHPGDYVSWLDVPTLPKLDHASPALQERLYGPGSVVERWLRPPFELDGWRIDVANMTGRLGADDLAHDVARALRATMRRVDRPTWLLAEHGHDFSGDVLGGGWHGSMNYSGFTRPVWSWLSTPGHGLGFLGLPVEVPTLPGAAVAATIRDFSAAVPWRALTHSFLLLDSHDTPRLRTVAGTRERHLLGLALQMTMPGVPMVWAGDELGGTAVDGEDSRRPFPWDRPAAWDLETFEAYRTWIALRRSQVALRRGGMRWVSVGAEHLTYLREHPDGDALVHVVRGAHEPVRLPAVALGLERRDLVTLHGDAADVTAGRLALPTSVGAHAYALGPRGSIPPSPA